MNLSLLLKYNQSESEDEDIQKQLQENMTKALENKYIYEFKTKIDMPYFRETGYINMDKTRVFPFIKKPAKLKEAVYNSVALTFLTYPSVLTPGDYITTMPHYRDGKDDEWTYIVRSEAVREYKHDEVFAIKCPFSVKVILNGKLEEVPISVFDNKTMIRESHIGAMNLDTTSTWIFCQDNEITRHFGVDIERVIIDGLNYKFMGRGDRVSALEGVAAIGLKLDERDSRDDTVNGIAYNGNKHILAEEISGTNELLFDIEEKYTSKSDCIWSVSDKSVQVNVINGKECTLHISYDMNKANDIFTLKASINGREVTKKIRIKE